MAQNLNTKFTLEDHVNDWVKNEFTKLKLQNQIDYYTESAIPDYLKEALKWRAKTQNKTNFWKPDFSLTKYDIPVVIENKLGVLKLISESKEWVKFEDKAISGYAVNWALHYARWIIESWKYSEVIAIWIAWDSTQTIQIKVYYVYGSWENSFKLLENISTLDFLENETTFSEFYNNAILTEEEKHEILIKSQGELQKYAKSLNKLMHNLNITAPQRVLYVSWMLLSMQNIVDIDWYYIQDWLVPDDLKGIPSDTKRDWIQITNQIKEFVKSHIF